VDADTCYTCHKSQRAKAMRTSHHPVREGKMDCSSCHNPHEGNIPNMLKADSVNELVPAPAARFPPTRPLGLLPHALAPALVLRASLYHGLLELAAMPSGPAAPLDVPAAIDRLVDDCRPTALWHLRRDYYPRTDEERERVLRLIEQHGDVEAYRRARTLREWLSRTSSARSAGC
jgi:predicted CXXCH cytochrome family protein